jgi:uncharacterized protein (DUF58 family)
MPLPAHWHEQILPRLARVSLTARLAVEGFLAGEHRSNRRGQSVEFAGHRPYLPGDDVRRVDWPLWARSDRLDVRLYEEESQLRAMIAIDASGSMGYGGAEAKIEAARTLAAGLAVVLARHGDAVGLAVLGGGGLRQLVPPSATPAHLITILERLQELQAEGPGGCGEALGALAPRLPRRGLLVLITDACEDAGGLLRGLRLVRARRTDVRLWHLLHEDEGGFPFAGDVRFLGLEGEPSLALDADRVRPWYLRALAAHRAEIAVGCRAAGIDLRGFRAGDDVALAIAGALR